MFKFQVSNELERWKGENILSYKIIFLEVISELCVATLNLLYVSVLLLEQWFFSENRLLLDHSEAFLTNTTTTWLIFFLPPLRTYQDTQQKL